MRIRNAGLIASRILAVYVGFTAVIFSGEFIHDVYLRQPAGVLAESLAPVAVALGLAAALWAGAPAIARRMSAGAEAIPEDEPPARSRDIATIAFAIAGLYIASQAVPLGVHATVRLAAGASERRDAAADLISAVVRAGIGVAVAARAAAIGRAMFPAAR